MAWELFLRGQRYYWVEADGRFDPETVEATKSWQCDQGLNDDGVVGPKTYGKAQLLGFNPGFEDDGQDETGPNWPARPEFSPLSHQQRVQLFGSFAFRPAPVAGNPEAIIMTDGWDRHNIVRIDIPVLDRLDRKLGDDRYSFHVKCADQIRDFFQAVDDAGLADRILTFDGSWAPRFVRGSRTYLSNHAWGTAVDLNARWNGLTCVPALKGRQGSVRELVPIAHQFGLYWGGHFDRQDGMHVEVARLL